MRVTLHSGHSWHVILEDRKRPVVTCVLSTLTGVSRNDQNTDSVAEDLSHSKASDLRLPHQTCRWEPSASHLVVYTHQGLEAISNTSWKEPHHPVPPHFVVVIPRRSFPVT